MSCGARQVPSLGRPLPAERREPNRLPGVPVLPPLLRVQAAKSGRGRRLPQTDRSKFAPTRRDLVTEPPSAAGRRAAARYLVELLLRPGRYRRLWEKFAERTRPGEINQLAVAETLAHHLWDFPRSPSDADVLPRQLKDTVARALSGRLLSRSTLSLFIDAFGFSDDEALRLWRLWQGSGAISVLSGPRAMPPDKMAEVAAALGPRKHQTVSMHDHVYVGADGRLARTRTLQVVEAITDGLDRIPYLYDTSVLTLEVGQGCAAPAGPLYQIREGVFAIDIPLAKSLAVGETLTLEY